MNDFLYFRPTCKTIYEIVRNRVLPPAEPVCERCQQDLPVAEDGESMIRSNISEHEPGILRSFHMLTPRSAGGGII